MVSQTPQGFCPPFPDWEVLSLSSEEDREIYDRIKSLWDAHAPGWCEEVCSTILANMRKIKITRSNRGRPSAQILWREVPWNLGHWVLLYCIYRANNLSRVRLHFMKQYTNIELDDFGHACFQQPLVRKTESEGSIPILNVPSFQPAAAGKKRRELSSIPEEEPPSGDEDYYRPAKRANTEQASLGIDTRSRSVGIEDARVHENPSNATWVTRMPPPKSFSTFKQRVNDTSFQARLMSLGPTQSFPPQPNQAERDLDRRLSSIEDSLSRIASSMGSLIQQQCHLEKQTKGVMDQLALVDHHIEKVGEDVSGLNKLSHSVRLAAIESYLDVRDG